MSFANNTVFLSGRLTRDPNVGEKITTFTIAVDRAGRSFDDAGFFPVVVFSNFERLFKWANENLKKGFQVNIVGRLRRSVDGEGQDSKVYWDVIAQDISLVNTPRGTKPTNGSKSENDLPEGDNADSEDLTLQDLEM